MIELSNLCKRYGDKVAVDDFSLNIAETGVIGLLGRNGAGKSTTMNMMTGYIPPSSGSVMIDGINIHEQPDEAKRFLGYLPEHPPLYPDMTVAEYLRFAAGLKGLSKNDANGQIRKVTGALSIEDVQNRLIRQLSKGYRQRTGIAQAVLGTPKYVILDEPTSGLDPVQIKDVRSLIKELASQCAVVLSSHLLTEAADICKQIVIIHKGKIVVQDSVDSLINENRIIVRTDRKLPEDFALSVPGITDIKHLNNGEDGEWDYCIECKPGSDLRREIAESCCGKDIGLLVLRPAQATLEDVFLQAIDAKG